MGRKEVVYDTGEAVRKPWQALARKPPQKNRDVSSISQRRRGESLF
jgi:hypothetical protein